MVQLPKALADPIVGIIGPECYTTLVEDLNLGDQACLKLALSKGLGIAIITGGSIVKIPQIITILKNRSTQGLSLSSYLLEVVANVINLAYNARAGNPFSTWGEMLFLTTQNIIITLLIFAFSKQTVGGVGALGAILAIGYMLMSPQLVNPTALASLFAGTIPLNIASKIPQIMTNYTNGSTGQLSAFAVMNYLFGSLARVFTTATELDDPLMLSGTSLGALFNAILAGQVLYYSSAKAKAKKVGTKAKAKVAKLEKAATSSPRTRHRKRD
ncbi:hypothetical protein BZG36_02478 [Bifiguratus adelaidae]|uniref:Mannose-P-dolichol utilization defect 1 protein homolog n=1 Tax=Bifiguratus adelaidae TaxID=1938954 RepID=A0A261Y0Y7_9FUNG|nr:hypothetical protein BZG36_02478 [Bifiguratus adelaidae]